MEDKNTTGKRYSDEDLEMFRQLILKKLEKAREDMKVLMDSVNGSDGNDVLDTSPSIILVEEGQSTQFKEENSRLAGRLQKYIKRSLGINSPVSRQIP